MIHSTHRLKAYTADVGKRLAFCEKCGKEEDEGLSEPCTNKFYVPSSIDTTKEHK